MVKKRLHPGLKKVPAGVMGFALFGLCILPAMGRAGQLVGETLRNRARSAADTASAAAQSSGTSPQKLAQGKSSKAPLAKKPGARQPIPMSRRAPVLVGLRDPFKLPPPPGPGGEPSAPGDDLKGPLPPGTRGLVINQVRLEGVVRLDQSNTMIAVISNYTNRAYFVREGDAVYNGVVTKIRPDS